MTLPKLDDYNFRNKRVIVRTDFNVPLDDDGNITNDERLKSAAPTIQYLMEQEAQQIILMSHLGRPKCEVVDKFKMDKVAERFGELIGHEIIKAEGTVDINIPFGKIILLENLRFNKSEKSKVDIERQEFAKKLADFADLYVNDAFGTCHRKHASMYDITKYLPSCAGLLVAKELKVITENMIAPERPFVAIMGGAKVSDKFEVIRKLAAKVDSLLIGGAMIFTFYKAMGKEVGKSLVDDDMLKMAKELLIEKKDKIVLPTDVVCAEEGTDDAAADVFKIDDMPKDMIGLDIGPETINAYKKIINDARTIIWNGPMGMFEVDQFALGTNEIAKALADNAGTTIVGGGDSVAAVEKLDIQRDITHISTGGGASLELFEGKELIAVTALEDNFEKFQK